MNKKINYFNSREEVCKFLEKFDFKYEIPDLRRHERYCIELDKQLQKIFFCSVECVCNDSAFTVAIFYDASKSYLYTKAMTDYQVLEESFSKFGITVNGKSIADKIIHYVTDTEKIFDCGGDYTIIENSFPELHNEELAYIVNVENINKADESIIKITLLDVTYYTDSVLRRKLHFEIINLQERYNCWRKEIIAENKFQETAGGSHPIYTTYDCGESSAREGFSNYAHLEKEISFEDMLELEKTFNSFYDVK